MDNVSPDYFFILHLNIKSIKKNIKNFKSFLRSINSTFSVICFSETWLDNLTLSENASYEVPNSTSKHQVQGNRKGSTGSIYIYNSLNLRLGQI